MVILQRWEPTTSPHFPSLIPFWIKVQGIPIHLWTEDTIKRLGEDIGVYEEADITSLTVRMRVYINGRLPLIKQSIIEYKGGNEVTAHFVYERLEKHCSCCNRLDHDIHDCLEAKARKRAAKKAKEAEENPYRVKDTKEKEDKARVTDPQLTLSTTGDRFDSRRSYDSDYHRKRRDREEHGRTTRHHPYRRSERGSSGERGSQYLPTQRQRQPYHKTQDRHSREPGYRADSRDPHWEQPYPSYHIDRHTRNYGYEP